LKGGIGTKKKKRVNLRGSVRDQGSGNGGDLGLKSK